LLCFPLHVLRSLLANRVGAYVPPGWLTSASASVLRRVGCPRSENSFQHALARVEPSSSAPPPGDRSVQLVGGIPFREESLGRQNPWVGRILRRFDGHDVAVRACIVRVPQEVSRALAFAVVFSSRVSGIHFIEVSFLQRIAIILYGLPYPWVVRDSCGYAFRNWSVLSHTRPGSAACSHS